VFAGGVIAGGALYDFYDTGARYVATRPKP
jgi:hypothetical protein